MKLVAAEVPARTRRGDKAEKTDAADPANGGIRREPELPEHEAIEPVAPVPTGEFDFGDREDGDGDAIRNRRLADRMRQVARQASLDPKDGVEL